MTTKVEFAGVTTTTTGSYDGSLFIRKPAALKMLRSGRLEARCRQRTTDDYAFDAADNFGRRDFGTLDPAALAEEIEGSSSRGWCFALDTKEDGTQVLSLSQHNFRYLEARVAPESKWVAPTKREKVAPVVEAPVEPITAPWGPETFEKLRGRVMVVKGYAVKVENGRSRLCERGDAVGPYVFWHKLGRDGRRSKAKTATRAGWELLTALVTGGYATIDGYTEAE